MRQFEFNLQAGEDASTGLPALGFEHGDMFIHDPFLSECGRFAVDPVEAYQVSLEDAQELVRLNKLIDSATQAALNAGCLAIQVALCIPTGDVAGAHFSASEQVRPIAQAMVNYLLAEYADGTA